jgi:hypothetical protein
MKEFINLKGNIVIERRKKDGTVIDREEKSNLIVTTGKDRVRDLIGNLITGNPGFSHMAIGESGTGDSVSASDTELVSEVKRVAPTISSDTGSKVIFEHTFTFGTAESYAIAEVGIFDNTTATGSTMFNRAIFSAKNVDVDTDLYIKITITVS